MMVKLLHSGPSADRNAQELNIPMYRLNEYYLIFIIHLNIGSLQRVWRCRQTNFVLDKGGVKSVLGTALCHHEAL